MKRSKPFIIIIIVLLVVGSIYKGFKNGTYDDDKSVTPEYRLAVINDKSSSPNKLTIGLFHVYLEHIQIRYPNKSKEDIANSLDYVFNVVAERTNDLSLLEFVSGFDAYLKEIDPKYNIDLETNVALFAKSAYKI